MASHSVSQKDIPDVFVHMSHIIFLALVLLGSNMSKVQQEFVVDLLPQDWARSELLDLLRRLRRTSLNLEGMIILQKTDLL